MRGEADEAKVLGGFVAGQGCPKSDSDEGDLHVQIAD